MGGNEALKEVKSAKCFGGKNVRYELKSKELGCTTTFTVYYPPAAQSGKVPIIYFLAGLTCDDENFINKAGAQRTAAALGVALVCPDTSPRGLDVPGESESWDFGVGAGFYLNATQERWRNWRMYAYITEELPAALRSLPLLDVDTASVMGHSMGGHGALVLGLRNPARYRSISAFSPIAHPCAVPWGHKAFGGYLGDDRAAWKQYDATELAGEYSGPKRDILIDVGTTDPYLENQLKPDDFSEAAAGSKALEVQLRKQDGYDHSYAFISTFVDDHLRHHAKALKA
ncbi:hypothetical protein WJX81_004933 [Elliptochloris bilobata]|uniref:S-formylglutathione hydrolase n=1 Tax=Elliptochloris bilobata TaxID=381761 RepID=A0AAW1RTF3_9CHLO